MARVRCELALIERDQIAFDTGVAYLESIRDEVQVERYLSRWSTAPRPATANRGGMMEAELSNPSNMTPPVGAYSHVARVPLPGADLLVISGQLAADLDDTDIVNQTEQVMEQLRLAVESFGGTMGHIIKITSFVTRIERREELRALRRRVFRRRFPASTLVQGGCLRRSAGPGRDRGPRRRTQDGTRRSIVVGVFARRGLTGSLLFRQPTLRKLPAWGARHQLQHRRRPSFRRRASCPAHIVRRVFGMSPYRRVLVIVGVGAFLVGLMPGLVAAGSGVGGILNLGVNNTVMAFTKLTASTAASAFQVQNNGTGGGIQITVGAGKAPITVSAGAGKAVNLNADMLDGKDVRLPEQADQAQRPERPAVRRRRNATRPRGDRRRALRRRTRADWRHF